jgi:predicted dehydrogenase
MTHQIRWGILSTANITRSIIRGVGMSSSSCVQAVASRDFTRAGEWAKEHGVPRIFGSYEELLNSGEVDVIYNPLPNSMHAEWTIKALEAGYPVLCEKPFAISAAEAGEILAASKRTGRLVAEAFMYRQHPMYDKVIDLVRNGAIGTLTSIRSIFTFALPDRNNIVTSSELAGGSLMDVGCYCVNIARLITGREPIRVQAMERRNDVDDSFFGLMEFPDGVYSQFESSIESQSRERAEIAGTDGAIIIESPWFPGERQAQFTLLRGENSEIIQTPGANCYHLEIEDFVNAHRTHSPLRWPPEDAVANMAVIDALFASARESHSMEVSPV